eukprot:scaffold77762_cov48-Phaeocystis_antarctica.AAC.2
MAYRLVQFGAARLRVRVRYPKPNPSPHPHPGQVRIVYFIGVGPRPQAHLVISRLLYALWSAAHHRQP